MNDQEYSVDEAQQEAEKLKQKIVDGEASNYNDAEKLVEKDKIKKKISTHLRSYLTEISADGYLNAARSLQQKFGIPAGELEADSVLQEEARQTVLLILQKSYLDKYDLDRIEGIKTNLCIPNEVYMQPEFQEAARKAIRASLLSYLNRFNNLEDNYADENLNAARSLQQKFSIPAGEIEADPEIQEEAKKAMLIKLKHGSLDKIDRIKTNMFIPDEIYMQPEFQEAARKITRNVLLSYLEENFPSEYLSLARSLQQKFSIPAGELEADPEIQEAARQTLLRKLQNSYLDIHHLKRIEGIKTNMFIPDEVFMQPEFQEAARKAIMAMLLNYLYSSYSSQDLRIARSLQQIFGIPAGELETDPEIQKKARQILLGILYRLDRGNDLESIEKIKTNFFITDEVYMQPEFQKAARKAIRASLLKYLDATSGVYLNVARSLQQKFSIPAGELETDPEIQEAARKAMLIKLQHGFLAEFEIIKSSFFVPDDIYIQPEFQEAAKKGLAKKIKSYFTYGYDETLKTILDANKFELPWKFFEEIFRPAILESGELDIILRVQKIDFVPADFFKQQEISEKITQMLSISLQRGDFEYVEQAIQQLGISSDIYQILDIQASVSTLTNLIRFITYLGNKDLYQKFPLTLERAKELIVANLDIDEDIADYFVENLHEYYQQPWATDNVAMAVQHYSVAKKFISAVEDDAVWANEPWVIAILENAKVIVQSHKDKFGDEYEYNQGIEGFRERDPYENHPWLFTGQQIKISSALSGLLSDKIDEAQLQELGINDTEVAPILAEVKGKIYTAYQNFLQQVRSNQKINEESRQYLLNPELSPIRTTPLIESIHAFVARYFVQSIEGDVTRLSEIRTLASDLDRIIAEGFRRYIKVLEVDVPLYDKLYEEFDNLREIGRYPLEVFLGRDGIYAWIGRRAQDVARRRKMGPEGRKKLKEMGEVIEIHPQYTVYPRYFRDNLTYNTKRQFLEQEGISPDVDPLFYDTGYTGTIPEQIMKIMGFEDEDIEKRIRLLSAPSVHRRVKGIPVNARAEIIEYIEHNAKLEGPAEGLIIDEKTGKIRHIAKPTTPEEQLYFMMVKQAIERHYWLQEQLHHEPSGNVNLDSEHYSIRIRQDYAKLLPQEFLNDPKAFFAEHGELMKGSKGEGEYPDEEVILFRLDDETEIVAKKIELRKAKEARKEFAILIAAKKAGLPTAEPIGFLSGKEDADGSYLLMKKVDGRSGRKFEKELTDSGKYTPEQIKTIMQQVAQKNREMAELFRMTLGIDKRWRIKDTIIEFNEETGEVVSVIPIDWERAENYNPTTPNEIDEIQ